jgi:hypothetical protein
MSVLLAYRWRGKKGQLISKEGIATAIDLSVPGNGRRRSLVESMPSREFRSPVRKQTFVPLFFDECFPFPPYVVRPELVLISQMMDQFQDKERDIFSLTHLAVLLEGSLSEVGVHLDLVYGRDRLAHADQVLQLLDREVRHADRL